MLILLSQLQELILILSCLRNHVLQRKDDISDGIGSPVPLLAICLFISWLCIFISMAKGIKTSGKAAYVFAILPYVILITILIVALNLDGAWKGIEYFIIPKYENSTLNGTIVEISVWERLFDLKIWYLFVIFPFSIC